MTEAREALARYIAQGRIEVREGRARWVDGTNAEEHRRAVDALYRLAKQAERLERNRAYQRENAARLSAVKRERRQTDPAYAERRREQVRQAKARARERQREQRQATPADAPRPVNEAAIWLQAVWGVGVVDPDGRQGAGNAAG